MHVPAQTCIGTHLPHLEIRRQLVYVGPRDRSKIMRLGGKCLYQLSHPVGFPTYYCI